MKVGKTGGAKLEVDVMTGSHLPNNDQPGELNLFARSLIASRAGSTVGSVDVITGGGSPGDRHFCVGP